MEEMAEALVVRSYEWPHEVGGEAPPGHLVVVCPSCRQQSRLPESVEMEDNAAGPEELEDALGVPPGAQLHRHLR